MIGAVDIVMKVAVLEENAMVSMLNEESVWHAQVMF